MLLSRLEFDILILVLGAMSKIPTEVNNPNGIHLLENLE